MVIGLKIPFNWVIFRLFNPIYVEKKVLNEMAFTRYTATMLNAIRFPLTKQP